MPLSPSEVKRAIKKRSEQAYQDTVAKVDEILCSGCWLIAIGSRDKQIPHSHANRIAEDYRHAGWKVTRDHFAPACRPDGATEYLDFRH